MRTTKKVRLREDPIDEIILVPLLGEHLDSHEALTVVEAQDAEARRRMPPENRQVRLERRVEETDRRSEEHTSELQSHHDLVCRLLLEKKKNQLNPTP